MRPLLIAALAPVGFVAGLIRPWLSFGYIVFAALWLWALANPGWFDPDMTSRLFYSALGCYASRYGCDLVGALMGTR